jgi:Lrp/AsnC family leucine-responsive transcriptional regulator
MAAINEHTSPRLDSTDRAILDLLQDDARRSRGEIGRQVGLSPAAVHERIRKLERAGVIRGYAALLDPELVRCDLLAFVHVFIDHPRHEARFLEEIGTLDEVQECHRVTGSATCLLKVRLPDRRALQTLVLDRINALSGVRHTETIVVLSTTKETPRIRPGAADATPGETP